MKKLIVRLACAASLVVLCASTGCGEGYPSYCDSKINCEGGNDNDKSACVDSIEGEEEQAEDYGCGDQFDQVFTCESNGASCVQGQYATQSNCQGQRQALDTCIQANSGRKK